MKRLLVLWGGVLLLGCLADPKEVRMWSVSHNNGLVVQIPKDARSLKETDKGYKLSLSRPDGRHYNSISIKLLGVNPYTGMALKEKYIDEVIYLYSEEKYEGGSGGAEYKLSIWKKLPSNGGLGVAITQHQQSERDVDYDIAWRIAESAALAR